MHNSSGPPASKEACNVAMDIVQDIKTHSHTWRKTCEELRAKTPQILPDEEGTEESITYDSDGSDSKPPPLAMHYINQHGRADNECSSSSDSSGPWIPPRLCPIRRRAPESVDGCRTMEEIGWDMMTQEGTQTANCLTQLPQMASESKVEGEMPIQIIELATVPDDSEEEDVYAILAA
jgi:hypothetical protein